MRALLVPVKSFREAKHRLANALGDEARRQLVKDLAHVVLEARGSAPAFVACDDSEVADWSITEGATVLWTPRLGLSGAVGESVRLLAGEGFTLVTIAHADLPFAHDLDRFGALDQVTIAPDHRLDGTNVISVPTSSPFTFFYGPRSYLRHQEEALARGIDCKSVFDWRLASDVDLPSDLGLVGGLLESER